MFCDVNLVDTGYTALYQPKATQSSDGYESPKKPGYDESGYSNDSNYVSPVTIYKPAAKPYLPPYQEPSTYVSPDISYSATSYGQQKY